MTTAVLELDRRNCLGKEARLWPFCSPPLWSGGLLELMSALISINSSLFPIKPGKQQDRSSVFTWWRKHQHLFLSLRIKNQKQVMKCKLNDFSGYQFLWHVSLAFAQYVFFSFSVLFFFFFLMIWSLLCCIHERGVCCCCSDKCTYRLCCCVISVFHELSVWFYQCDETDFALGQLIASGLCVGMSAQCKDL